MSETGKAARALDAGVKPSTFFLPGGLVKFPLLSGVMLLRWCRSLRINFDFSLRIALHNHGQQIYFSNVLSLDENIEFELICTQDATFWAWRNPESILIHFWTNLNFWNVIFIIFGPRKSLDFPGSVSTLRFPPGPDTSGKYQYGYKKQEQEIQRAKPSYRLREHLITNAKRYVWVTNFGCPN